MATPPRLLIEALLVPGDTVPTNVVRAVVIANRFNHVRRLAIAAFTAMSFVVLSGNHDRWCESYHAAEIAAEASSSHSLKTPR